jgi:diacylglycerol kinase family enzyme
VRQGAGLSILVNANAKRGGRRVAAQLRERLPKADVKLSRHPEETESWLRHAQPGRCLLAAGGDGTAMGMVNALHRVRTGAPAPPTTSQPHAEGSGRCATLGPLGMLPLGTGNAWAHVTGARKLGWCVDRLVAHEGPIPTRRFGLVEAEGVLCHFAGCGWDSEILQDFKSQLAVAKGPSKLAAGSVYGYLSAMALRTVPKSILHGRPLVTVENLGERIFTLDARGQVVERRDLRPGALLFEGHASLAGAATCPEFGYRFRAYPYAERMPGLINVRVFEASVFYAVPRIPWIWAGARGLRGMHDWFAEAVRITFSRPVAFQLGGDAWGIRRTVELRASPTTIDMVDFFRLGIRDQEAPDDRRASVLR